MQENVGASLPTAYAFPTVSSQYPAKKEDCPEGKVKYHQKAAPISGISPDDSVGSTTCQAKLSCPFFETSTSVLFRYGHSCPRKVTPFNAEYSLRYTVRSRKDRNKIYNQYTNSGQDLDNFQGYQTDLIAAMQKYYNQQLEVLDELQEYFDTSIALPKPTLDDIKGDAFASVGNEVVGWVYVITNAVNGAGKFLAKHSGKAVGYVNILVFAWAIFSKAAPDRSAIYLNENFVKRFNQNVQLQNNAKEYLVALRNFVEEDRDKATSIFQPDGFLNRMVHALKDIAALKDNYKIKPALRDRLADYYAPFLHGICP